MGLDAIKIYIYILAYALNLANQSMDLIQALLNRSSLQKYISPAFPFFQQAPCLP